jgi:hypothetical protein
LYNNGLAKCYLRGKVGIGTGITSPTAYLQIAAGTASAGTAPLKINAGTNLTTPEDGAIEYDGTDYFLTVSTTRYILTRSLGATAVLDFGNTLASTSSDLTVSVTGAAVGDAVSIGIPAAPNANSSFTAWVSASDVVTVRFNNYSTLPIDPSSGTFKVRIIK